MRGDGGASGLGGTSAGTSAGTAHDGGRGGKSGAAGAAGGCMDCAGASANGGDPQGGTTSAGGQGDEAGAPTTAGSSGVGQSGHGGSGAGGSTNGGDAGMPAGDAGEGGAPPVDCTPEPEPGAPPVLRYAFDEDSGTTAANAAGEGEATLTGAVWTDGRLASGVEFSDAEQYVTLPPDILLDRAALTVAAWVRLAANPVNSVLFDFGSAADNRLYLEMNVSGGMRLGAQTSAGASAQISSSMILPRNAWKHVTAVIAGGEAALYVDGLMVARGAFAILPRDLGATSENWIGRSHASSVNLSGTVDELRVYDRALPSPEIAQLAPPGDDYLYFPFDETCGDEAHDISNRALVGTLPNGGSWTDGRLGKSLVLDRAASQYLVLPDGVVEDCDDFTLALWAWMAQPAPAERLIDFGQSRRTFLYLTPKTSNGGVRFAIKLDGDENDSNAEQFLSTTTALPGGLWQHVAVVLENGTGHLYVNGAQVAEGSIALRPSDLGRTVMNSVGRSQYFDHPYLAARIDDLRIACRAYTAGEIKIIALTGS
ncbi:MAG TPA: LamG domain-containing protein [Polyangiaceae bacterium]